jgi:hypothetical protein
VAPVLVGVFAEVGVVDGEQVEYHVGGGEFQGETAGPARSGTQPVLQRGEVEPPRPPDHQFPVEDGVGVEGGDSGGDVGEVRGEHPLLPRLHHHLGYAGRGGGAEGEGAEAVEFCTQTGCRFPALRRPGPSLRRRSARSGLGQRQDQPREPG